MTQPERAAVIIPALNESATVGSVVQRVIRSSGLPVWVVNDASSDDTEVRARAAGARVINLPQRLGAWGATQTGLREAKRLDLELVITMDADGQHEASDIKRLLQKMRGGGADAIIGCCTDRGSKLQFLAWAMLRATSGLSYRDPTSGFRVLGRDAIGLLSGGAASFLDYQDVGVLLMLDHAGMHVDEIPVTMPLRTKGKSKIFASWFKVATYMAQTLLLGTMKRRYTWK